MVLHTSDADTHPHSQARKLRVRIINLMENIILNNIQKRVVVEALRDNKVISPLDLRANLTYNSPNNGSVAGLPCPF